MADMEIDELNQPIRHQTGPPIEMATFANLSPEMRNRIYHLALPKGLTYHIGEKLDVFMDSNTTPALCQVSCHIRDETLPIWRYNNFFRFQTHPDSDVMQLLLPHVNSQLQCVQHLTWDHTCVLEDDLHRKYHDVQEGQTAARIVVRVVKDVFTIETQFDMSSVEARGMSIRALDDLEAVATGVGTEMAGLMARVLGRELRSGGRGGKKWGWWNDMW